FVENATVIASVKDKVKYKKVKIIMFKRRKHYMKRQGHRQTYTEVKIKSIEINS
ncbi:MAG: 50S ribosomal protein L21, partial [Pseudomonadota bacterium]|nr:50S ribosomal protein L21 [Pseudomonadota bacterium]